MSLKIGYEIPCMYVLVILKFFDPHQKSYGFRRVFLIGVFVRRPEKCRFKSAEISAASSMGVSSYCWKRKLALKVLWARFSQRVDPLPAWSPAAAALMAAAE